MSSGDHVKTNWSGPAEAIVSQIPAVVWTTDTNLVFTSSVGGGLAALGLQPGEVTGITLFQFFRSEDRDFEPIRAHIRALDGESVKFETEWVGRRHETLVEPFRDEQGDIIGTLGISMDVTVRVEAEQQREQLEAQLRQRHKLEAIGQLAGGVAHEINNPVQSIMNFAQLIRSRSKDATLSEYAEEILHEAQRVAGIVRNLQNFARQADEIAIEVVVPELVERTLSLFRNALLKEDIELHVELAPDLPLVWCRPQGLQQMLVNLLTGAREALNHRFPAADASKWIRVSVAAHGEGASRRLRLVVADCGTPIAPGDEARVFEPFSSLPGRDHGSGLGLSITHDMARDNDATLNYEGEAGQTRFVLDLPLADAH